MAQQLIIIDDHEQLPGVHDLINGIYGLADYISSIKEEARAASDIATVYVKVAHAFRILEAAQKQIKRLENELKTELVPKRFEIANSTSCSVLGYRVTTSTKSRVSIREGMKDPAFSWLRANGHGTIIKTDPYVDWQTLDGWGRQMLEDGEELDDKLFSVFLYDTTSLTKVARKK